MLRIGPSDCEVTVDGFYLVSFREFDEDYLFEGERHPFHELVYIRRGKVAVLTDTRGYLLQPGDLVLFAPDEFHCLWAGSSAISMFIFSFHLRPCRREEALSCAFHAAGPVMTALDDLMAACREALQNLPAPCQIQPDQPFAGLQLVKNRLEALLIMLMRGGSAGSDVTAVPDNGRTAIERRIVAQAEEYLRAHCRGPCTLEEVCRHIGLGKSLLTELFHRHTGESVMRRHQQLRLEAAMDCLREGNTVTETAALLQFSSIHTFSRMFKQHTGVPPSQFEAKNERER